MTTEGFPSPYDRAVQKKLNEVWPPRPRDFGWQKQIPVWVRVDFDGEEWCAGSPDRWDRHYVHVWFIHEPRAQVDGIWVLARNVHRRMVPTL